MEFHEQLRNQYQLALSRNCEKEGCALRLSSLPQLPIIIDADKYRALTRFQGKLPDFWIFPIGANIVFLVVELKGGRLDSRRAVEQVRGGSTEGERILNGRTAVRFYPVVAYGRIGHASELKVLRTSKVRFQGRDYLLIARKCGTELWDILQRYGR